LPKRQPNLLSQGTWFMTEIFRELLFRVVPEDFDRSAIRGSGPGGQHRNKVATGVRLRHRASGAVGEATNSKSRLQNQAEAFRRLRETPEWKAWYREMVFTTQGREPIAAEVERAMADRNIRTQVLDDHSRWVDVAVDDLL